MMFSSKQMEAREKKILRPYAVCSAATKGRAFPEPEDETRTCFQRDRDRIVHSKAFRRLAGKTQVFVATLGDHYRDRLCHTLEVAQVARDISRSLGLNEDLAEAIALAHDLGHTPFGHAGEHQLDRLMKKFGQSFEHNEQSKRIVEELEDRYPDFPGLNLSWEVREGLAKHQTYYDRRGRKISGKTLEAQVVDLADEIAYHNHDLDDGLRGKLFRMEDLRKLALWKTAEKTVLKKHGSKLSKKYLRHRTIGMLIGLMIDDVCRETARRIALWKIETPKDAERKPRNAVSFSPRFFRGIKKLRDFLWKKMYSSSKVRKHSRHGQKVITVLFKTFYKNPQLLPEKLQAKIQTGSPKETVIKDFIAGMTDTYALQFYDKILI